MRPANALTTVSAATRPGASDSQDRYFLADQAAIVLDGASAPDPQPLDGGWYADALGRRLTDRLTRSPSRDLRTTLADTIAEVADAADLTPGEAPSSTVAMFRWNSQHAEALVLGDSPVIARTATSVEQVRDDRLATVAPDARHAYHDALRHGEGYGDHHRSRMRTLVAAERAHRNQSAGYWIAEAEPQAATHAIYRRWPIHELHVVILATDGLARGVDQFHNPPSWQAAIEIGQTRDLGTLLDVVHDAEASDPHGRRWPRSKRHDDKTAVLVTFDHEASHR